MDSNQEMEKFKQLLEIIRSQHETFNLIMPDQELTRSYHYLLAMVENPAPNWPTLQYETSDIFDFATGFIGGQIGRILTKVANDIRQI